LIHARANTRQNGQYIYIYIYIYKRRRAPALEHLSRHGKNKTQEENSADRASNIKKMLWAQSRKKDNKSNKRESLDHKITFEFCTSITNILFDITI
jgi:hypothetical protein